MWNYSSCTLKRDWLNSITFAQLLVFPNTMLKLMINLHPLILLPADSPIFRLPVCLSGEDTVCLSCPCSASSPFPPIPLWMSTVGGLLQDFCGDEGGLSFTCPPPWRSFSFFCRRSCVLLVLSSLWTNDGRPCWEWESVETVAQTHYSYKMDMQMHMMIVK